jgi:hypothetical protein
MRLAEPAIIFAIHGELDGTTKGSIQRVTGVAHVWNDARENDVAVDLCHCLVMVLRSPTRLWLARLATIRQISCLITMVALASVFAHALLANTVVPAIIIAALRIALVNLDACGKSILVHTIFKSVLANA